MKIKTITCHDVYNVGASLQAYALSSFLRQKGHDVEIIHYKPKYLEHYELWGVRNPRFDRPLLREAYQLLKLPQRILARTERRKKVFDRFLKENLPVTNQEYRSNAELKSNPPEADLYLAGSDQIWNPTFQNGRDAAFFLDFAPSDARKASYAASFAVESIPTEFRSDMMKWLASFDAVSVREASGIQIAMGLGVQQPVLVCDPVFLLSSEEWARFERRLELPQKYLFVYDFDQNPQIVQFVREKAANDGLKIVSMFKNPYADVIADSAGPREFLALVHHADYVVSNSFHATAFSIIFHTPFSVFDRNEQINTRMSDLLTELHLKRHNNSVDDPEVDRLVEEQVRHSMSYLDQVVSIMPED